MKNLSLDDLIFCGLILFSTLIFFSVTGVEAALFLTLILLIIRERRERSLRGLRAELTGHPLFVPWILYLGVCLLTALTAYYPAKGFGQLNSDFLKYVCLSTLLLAVRKEHLPRLGAVYIAAAAISALGGIYESSVSFLHGDADIARAGAFMNAVRYGEVMTIAFTFSLAKLAYGGRNSFRGEKGFYLGAALLIFAAILFSQTRGAYLAVFIAFISMFTFGRTIRKRLLAAVTVMTIAGGLFLTAVPHMAGRLTSIATATQGDFTPNTPAAGINLRKEMWGFGLTMFRAHPLFGVGPDNAKKAMKKFGLRSSSPKETGGSLHSLYVHQAAERGLMGIFALLFLFAAMFRFALARFRDSQSPYTLWALSALPAFYVMNLTEISFQHVHTSFAIFLALAFAAASEKRTA